MEVTLLPFFVLLLLLFNATSISSESNPDYIFTKTRSYFNIKPDTVIAAYADINRDRKTDIISLSLDGKEVYVNYMRTKQSESVSVKVVSIPASSISTTITGIIPCDFDGDSLVDFVILTKTTSQLQTRAYILYNVYNNLNSAFSKMITLGQFLGQPVLFDYNADMIADFIGYNANDKKTHIYVGGSKITDIVVNEITQKWFQPSYSGFFDGLNDGNPGLLLTLKAANSEEGEFHYFYKDGPNFLWSKPIIIPLSNIKVLGPPMFQDWNFANKMFIIFPYCLDKACQKSGLKRIFDLPTGKVEEVFVDMKGFSWVLSDTAKKYSPLDYGSIMPLRSIDLFRSHYPDFVGIVKKGVKKQAVVVRPLTNGSMILEPLQGISEKIIDVTIFDFREDGIADLLSLEVLNNGKASVFIYEHGDGDRSFSSDNYFLKVMVLNGLCAKTDCPNGILPYGLPVTGVTVSYKTESTKGKDWKAKGSIMTTSNYAACQLPFHIFGLGDFANYIEHLYVSLPRNTNSEKDRSREFTFIVPKTQVVVVPYPIDKPSKWINQLYLEPFKDKKVIYVAITLLSTCLLVLVIICFLQYMEYREDKYERAQEVSAFNFDAM